MPQQAVANGIGQRLLARAWLASQSSWVTMKSGNFILLPPLEHALPPGVHVPDAQRGDEHDYFPEHDPAERLPPARPGPIGIGDDRPRVEEEQFDVEYQEQDGDQVELDVELHPGTADRVHPRLVRHELDRRLL